MIRRDRKRQWKKKRKERGVGDNYYQGIGQKLSEVQHPERQNLVWYGSMQEIENDYQYENAMFCQAINNGCKTPTPDHEILDPCLEMTQ